ncbi:RNA polymerase sigma factor [Leifsonia sp. NPDC058194]|uniref:RNA polymerase sigma factor n=1 Tax=Leifsonia sp. NPDC058194 TaxID=3346374 RepID=UPI0036DDC51B
MTAEAEADVTQSGFEHFVEDVAPDLLAYFARRVSPTEDAADCLSETLLVLWRRHPDLPTEGDARRAWAFGVARRVLANHRRGTVRRLALADQLRTALLTAPQRLHDKDEIAEALSRIKDQDRELVTLVLWDGLGVAEAGAVLGLKPATARTRFARAKVRLRALLS